MNGPQSKSVHMPAPRPPCQKRHRSPLPCGGPPYVPLSFHPAAIRASGHTQYPTKGFMGLECDGMQLGQYLMALIDIAIRLATKSQGINEHGKSRRSRAFEHLISFTIAMCDAIVIFGSQRPLSEDVRTTNRSQSTDLSVKSCLLGLHRVGD